MKEDRETRERRYRAMDWQAKFDGLNRRYFGGKVPAHRVVIEDLGEELYGLQEPLTRTIRLNVRYFPEETLPHEMIHAFLGHPASLTEEEAHGDDYVAEARRLIREGCPVDDSTYMDAVHGLSDDEWRELDPENWYPGDGSELAS